MSAGPTEARAPFRFSATTRVGFDETDAQGVVYYGRYMPYFDRARVEYWRHLGFSAHDDPARGEFVMRAFNIEYHAPARFDDVLEVFCRVSKIGRTSITFEFAVVLADGSDAVVSGGTGLLDPSRAALESAAREGAFSVGIVGRTDVQRKPAHLEADAVFGVVPSLVVALEDHPPGTGPGGRVLDGPWCSFAFDLVLAGAAA